MSRSSKANHSRIAASVPADLMLAPLVICMRLPLLAEEARNGGQWAAETALAINEKSAAMAEGFIAAHLSLLGSAARFWPELMAGRLPSALMGAAMERSMNAALQPAGRRIRANFRRLSSRL